MRYMIDTLDLPQKVKEKYSANTNVDLKNLRAFTYVFVCQKCGAELYGEFKYEEPGGSNRSISTYSLEEEAKQTWRHTEEECNAFKQQIKERTLEKEALQKHYAFARERYYASINDAVCPICGAKLLQEKGFFYPDEKIYADENKKLDYWGMKGQAEELYGLYISHLDKCTIDNRFRRIERVRKRIAQERTNELLNAKIQSYDIFVASGTTPIASTVKRDCESLKGYILNLIRLENNIYSLRQLLPNLYHRRLENDPVIVFEAYSPVYHAQEELKALREACHDAVEAIQKAKIYQPVIDITYPVEPTAPQMKKPGLFNKQKTLAENEAMTKQYQMAIACSIFCGSMPM